MPDFRPATLLRLHFCERDEYHGKPLHRCLIEKCRELQMTRVTAMRGLEGYGGESEIHRSRPVHRNLPIVISVIDVPEKIDRLIPMVQEMMDTGLIATSPVTILSLNRARRLTTAAS